MEIGLEQSQTYVLGQNWPGPGLSFGHREARGLATGVGPFDERSHVTACRGSCGQPFLQIALPGFTEICASGLEPFNESNRHTGSLPGCQRNNGGEGALLLMAAQVMALGPAGIEPHHGFRWQPFLLCVARSMFHSGAGEDPRGPATRLGSAGSADGLVAGPQESGRQCPHGCMPPQRCGGLAKLESRQDC